MKVKTGLVILSVFQSLAMQGQNWFGMNQSNYNGANSFYFNTAMAVSSPYKVSVNGFSTAMHFDNNYLTYKLPFSMSQWVRGKVPDQYKNANGKIAFKTDWFEENLDGNSKSFDLSVESRGPATLYNYNRRFAVGFFNRTRIGLQGFGISENMARIFRYGLDSSSNNIVYTPPNQIEFGEEYGNNPFTINMNSFSEIGIGGAFALIRNNYLTLSAGANIKYLMGKGSGYIKNNGSYFKINGYDSLTFGQMDFEYGYVQPSHFSGLGIVNLLNGKNAGTGLGFDLSGYIELKRPKGKIGSLAEIPDVEYFFRGGISVLDIGGITYNQDVTVRKITNHTSRTWVPGEKFAQAWAGGLESGLHYMDSTIHSLFTVSKENEIRAPLPTTLSLHADLKIVSKFFVGAQLFQSLRGRKSVSFRRPSSLMIMPRFESRKFEVSVPVSLFNDYQHVTLGLYLKLGPFFAGTDNLVSSISRSAYRGLNYYFGVAYGFGNSKKQDSY